MIAFSAGSYWLTLPNLYVAIAFKGLVLIAAGIAMLLICGFRMDSARATSGGHGVSYVGSSIVSGRFAAFGATGKSLSVRQRGVLTRAWVRGAQMKGMAMVDRDGTINVEKHYLSSEDQE